jgi:carbon monoxide dehydrogenase subunit G
MRKALKLIAGVLIAAVAIVLVLAATKPDVFQVRRSASIKAPPEKIFPLINDLHQFARWSPYETKDPAMKRAYSGAETGTGSIYEWDGNKNVGAGRNEIAGNTPQSNVTIQLDMFKPFEAHNMVEFTLVPQGETTTVTWSMQGRVPYFAKVVHVVFDMDKMVDGDFETGLANLKAIAEK